MSVLAWQRARFPLSVAAIAAGTMAAGTLCGKAEPGNRFVVTAPPRELGLDPFYKKYVDAGGLPVISSGQPRDEALMAAAEIVVAMLARRADLQKALIDGRVRIAVMAAGEVTTDIPEHSRLTPKSYWDKRARGLGGTPAIPTTS